MDEFSIWDMPMTERESAEVRRLLDGLRGEAERAKMARNKAEAALRCIGGLACYRTQADSYATLSGKLNAIAVQVSSALKPESP